MATHFGVNNDDLYYKDEPAYDNSILQIIYYLISIRIVVAGTYFFQ